MEDGSLNMKLAALIVVTLQFSMDQYLTVRSRAKVVMLNRFCMQVHTVHTFYALITIYKIVNCK